MALSKKKQPKRPKAKRQIAQQTYKDFFDSVKESVERDFEVRAELDTLNCDPQGIKRLAEISQMVQAELSSSVKQRLLSVGKGVITGGLDFVKSFVRAQSILYHSRTSTNFEEIRVSCQADLSEFQVLVSDLEGRQANVPKVFEIVLMKPELSTHLIWESWNQRYSCISEKAEQFRKRCQSHLNRIRNFHELRKSTLEAAEADYAATLGLLDGIIAKEYLKEMEQEYGSPGNNARKNPAVWLPILKDLEQTLKSHFDPEKRWECPGGRRPTSEGQVVEVVPAEVYKTINKILHYCYPGVWDGSSDTTAAIKVRCQSSRQ